MRRTLPRTLALAAAVLSFLAVGAVPASAQEQVAVNTSAFVLPASLTSAVLFPATAPGVANAAESVAPLPSMRQVQRYSAPRRPAVLPALYATSALLQGLDAHSTMKAISLGAHEANPIMKGAAGNKGALIAVKAGVAGASIYLCEKLWKRNPVGAIAVMAVMNGVNAAVVAHNYRVAKRLR